MVLTEQMETKQYLASMETAARTQEDQLFYNITSTAVTKASISIPGGYPADADPVTNPNDLVAKTNGSGNKIGPAIVLKVMSGDKVEIGVKSLYYGTGAGTEAPYLVSDVLGSLATGIIGSVGESKATQAVLSNGVSSPLLGALNSFRTGKNSTPSNKPKAYLNWILLDDQLKYVAGSSGATVVHDPGAIYPLTSNGPVTMTKNGFLYIYVSNETQNRDVFFDNLSIQHTTGPISEETHYYPFGLTMAGISSRALGAGGNDASCGCGNKRGFNGNEIQNKEFSDASGLEVYDFNARTYDQQIGRFIQIDPMVLSEDFLEEKEEVNGGAFNLNNLQIYAFAYNNPIRYNDPDGKCPNCIIGAIGAGIGALFGGGFELGKQLWRDGKVTSWKAVGGATVQGAITGGAAGFTGGASLVTTAAVAGTANVVGGTINRSIQGQNTTFGNVATDFTVGAVFGAAGKYIGDKASQLITKNNLIKELSNNGIKHTASDIVGIGKNSAGKVIFLESGNAKAGLAHIIGEHGKEFAQAGISQKDLPKFIMQAVLAGKQVGTQGTRPIYEVTFNGVTQRVAVTVGNNGYVVGANMVSAAK